MSSSSRPVWFVPIVLFTVLWTGCSWFKLNCKFSEPASPQAYYERLIEKYSRAYDLDPNMVKAVVRVESNWDPLATSRAGARGLMQVMPRTGLAFGAPSKAALYDPEVSIRTGCAYLSHLRGLFGEGAWGHILTAYNRGPKGRYAASRYSRLVQKHWVLYSLQDSQGVDVE